ncbi:MAG: hypothetical protein CMJ19_03195 [Phycisphaeraceae bacterium]|nr:hypothetical protein [Phycisphaeraceae bacterium]
MNKQNKRTVVTVLLLCVIATGIMVIRHLSSDTAGDADDHVLWQLRYTVKVLARDAQRVYVSLPDDAHSAMIQREAFFRADLAMDIQRNADTGSRSAVLLANGNGQWATWIGEFDIDPRLNTKSHPAITQPLKPAMRQRYLAAKSKTQVGSMSVNKALAQIPADQLPVARVQQIFEYCWLNISDRAEGHDDAADALTHGFANKVGRARAMVAMCRTAGFPSRLVTGFVLDLPGNIHPRTWVEVYLDGTWVSYDPTSGQTRFMNQTYLPVRVDGVEMVRGAEPGTWRVSYELNRLERDVSPNQPIAQLPVILDLTRLPSGMRGILAVLLLLPLGALVTAVFRNLIGLMTFGTFTPALLALSFLYSDPVTGMVVFVLVMFVGMVTRGLLEYLKLLMVPRLGVLLTLVVICLVLAISVLDDLGLTPSANAVILPMVIMTMLIERFYVCHDEDGLLTACKLLGGTLLVAACCFMLLAWKSLGLAFVHAPEMLLYVAGALLLIGRYAGYRLAELFRFRDMLSPDASLGS